MLASVMASQDLPKTTRRPAPRRDSVPRPSHGVGDRLRLQAGALEPTASALQVEGEDLSSAAGSSASSSSQSSHTYGPSPPAAPGPQQSSSSAAPRLALCSADEEILTELKGWLYTILFYIEITSRNSVWMGPLRSASGLGSQGPPTGC